MRAAIVIRSLLRPAGKPLPSACSWCWAITAVAPGERPIRFAWTTPVSTCSW